MFKDTYAFQKTTDLLHFLSSNGAAPATFEMVMDFSQRYLEPLNKKIDQDNAFPAHVWPLMGQQGLHGMTVAEEYGGENVGYLAHMAATEAISYNSPSVGLSYIAHSNLCCNPLQLHGNKEQKEKYLPSLVKGTHVGALAISEPNAGSDAFGMTTSAVAEGDYFRANGSKLWITNGLTADTIITYMRTKNKKLTPFIIEKGMDGFTTGKKIDKGGMRGSETAELFFDDCKIPRKNILGKPHNGNKVMGEGLGFERAILAAGAIGIAQHSLDYIIEYSQQRDQKKRPLAANQAYAHQIAQMHNELTISRKSLYVDGAMADKYQKMDGDVAAGAFLDASQKAVRITQHCARLAGGMGYTKDLPFMQNHADAMLYSFGGSAEEIRLEIIAQKLLKAFRIHAKMTEAVTSTSKFTTAFKKRRHHSNTPGAGR